MMATSAQAADVKIGFLGGITGPIEGAIPPIIDAAKFAVKQINDQGGILGGKLSIILADGKCNPQNTASGAGKLINVDNVAGIVGALCSSATIAAASSEAVPAGVVMISPASTSPAITTLADKDLVFRTAPSDSLQGKVLAKAVISQGIKKVALTYVNNDYGNGLADNFRAEFKRRGGTIAGDQPHEDKKSSYRSELATLAKGGAERLVMIAYPQGAAPVLIRQALEGGLFKKFIGPEAFYEPKLWKAVGIKNIEGALYTRPAAPDSPATTAFLDQFKAFKAESVGKLFTDATYDATFLLALAIQTAGSTDRAKIKAGLRAVADGKGAKVLPGEWGKALGLIKAGKAVDYVGASGSVDFDPNGDPTEAMYKLWQIKSGQAVELATYK
jgi:branched-chain amino acid transport system substrate-binding protein